MHKPDTLIKHGWVRYPIPLGSMGNFVENLDVIGSLVGSSLYEWQSIGGDVWIRRVM